MKQQFNRLICRLRGYHCYRNVAIDMNYMQCPSVLLSCPCGYGMSYITQPHNSVFFNIAGDQWKSVSAYSPSVKREITCAEIQRNEIEMAWDADNKAIPRPVVTSRPAASQKGEEGKS